jgi:hypothetical protein
MARLVRDSYIDSVCMLLSFNRSMQLESISEILFESSCSSHQGCVSSARFTSASPIVPSQVAVSVKSDPLRLAGLTSVKSDLSSDWLRVKDLDGGMRLQFYRGV